MGKFGVILPVGPGDKEIARATDVLSSVFFYEPLCDAIVLVDDVPQSRQLERLVDQLKPKQNTHCQVKVFVNPREGQGIGWSGGMTVGMLAGCLWLAKNTDIDFVLKLDTDSLVIAPFSDTVSNVLSKNPNWGQIGTFRRHSDGTPRDRTQTQGELPSLLKLAALRRRTDGTMHPQTTLVGRARRRAQLIRLAQSNGFVLGEGIQGGGYAVSRSLLDRMAQLPAVQDIQLFVDTTVCEDPLLTIICYACGLTPQDFNRDNEVFAVAWSSLPDTPPRLLERGYSVIHSVKDNAKFKEAETREFFQKIRSS